MALALDLARRLNDAGEEEARRQELRLSFAVIDAGGHVVAVARMDGADWITPDVALGKAWTAAAFRAPSDAQGQKAKDLVAFGGAISAATHTRFTPQIGGLPVRVYRPASTARPRARWVRRARPGRRTRRWYGRRSSRYSARRSRLGAVLDGSAHLEQPDHDRQDLGDALLVRGAFLRRVAAYQAVTRL